MIFSQIQRKADVLHQCDTGLHHGDAYGKTRCYTIDLDRVFLKFIMTDVNLDIESRHQCAKITVRYTLIIETNMVDSFLVKATSLTGYHPL